MIHNAERDKEVRDTARTLAEEEGKEWTDLDPREVGRYIDRAFVVVTRLERATADAARRDPEVVHLLSLLDYAHLPPHLKAISHPFWSVGHEMADHFDYGGYELKAGLRKLIESKDCMVRQAVVKHRTEQ